MGKCRKKNTKTMRIEKIEYGSFTEVNHLNPVFSSEKKKLRAILSLDPNLKVWNDNIPNLMISAFDLIEECNDHKCSSSYQTHPGNKIKDIGQIPLIIEHLMLGIINNVGKNENCHGLTCLSKENANLYNIFIECGDPQLGEFALSVAKNLIEDILIHGDWSPLWSYLLDSAIFLYPTSQLGYAIKEIMNEFGWSKEKSALIVKALSHLSFFYNEMGDA